MKELPVYEQQWIIAQSHHRALRSLGFTLTTTIWSMVAWTWFHFDFAYPLHYASVLLVLFVIMRLCFRAAQRNNFEQKLEEKLNELRRSVVWVEGDDEPAAEGR